mmetsp:Transcript_13647/g.23091  ORF Transcript_13647/g.23091 Transcript_13647/m.23091 type:complete len:215 (-) Transcript_13647:208-852(-)
MAFWKMRTGESIGSTARGTTVGARCSRGPVACDSNCTHMAPASSCFPSSSLLLSMSCGPRSSFISCSAAFHSVLNPESTECISGRRSEDAQATSHPRTAWRLSTAVRGEMSMSMSPPGPIRSSSLPLGLCSRYCMRCTWYKSDSVTNSISTAKTAPTSLPCARFTALIPSARARAEQRPCSQQQYCSCLETTSLSCASSSSIATYVASCSTARH